MTDQGCSSFEELRTAAYALLGDASDWLRSDWQGRLTPQQAEGRRQALRHIALAKEALNQAATGEVSR
ncbi:MAG: hypothetical protein JXA67_16515 [Micromonosporaceae bacterium]|nr:hypothetical protein [Micromonosporaceae bacterium]